MGPKNSGRINVASRFGKQLATLDSQANISVGWLQGSQWESLLGHRINFFHGRNGRNIDIFRV